MTSTSAIACPVRVRLSAAATLAAIIAAFVIDVASDASALSALLLAAAVLVNAGVRNRAYTLGVGAAASLAILLPAALGDLRAGPQDGFDTLQRLLALVVIWLGSAVILRQPQRRPGHDEEIVRNAFQHAPTGMVLVAPDGTILHVNDAVLALTGLTREQVVQRPLFELIDPEQAMATADERRELLSGARSAMQHELQYTLADGRRLHLALSVSMTRDAAGQPAWAVVQVIDHTATREAERALRESEARFRGIIEHTSELTFVVGPEARLRYVNPAFAAVIGAATRELAGLPLLDLVAAPDRERVQRALDQARLAQGTQLALDRVRLLSRLDARPVIEMKLTGLDATPGIAGTVANCRVMNEQIDAEEELRRNEARFSTIFHSSPDAIVIADGVDGHVIDFNAAFTRLTGLRREDAIGAIDADLPAWRTAGDCAPAALRRRMRNGEAIADVECVLAHAGGAAIDAEVSARFIEVDGALATLTVISDITVRKQAERALQASETRFARVFEASPDGIALIRLSDSLILDLNEAFAASCGWQRDELIGITTTAAGLWDAGVDRVELRRQLFGTGSFSNAELDLVARDGERVPVLVSAALVDIHDEPSAILLAKDMRELRRAHEQVRQSEARFREAFQAAPIGMLLLAPDGVVLEVNRTLTEMFARSEDDLRGTRFVTLARDDEREALAEALQQLVAGEDAQYRAELQFERSDGSVLWTNCNAVLQLTDRGDPLYFIVQLADISEMKSSQAQMERLAFYDTLTELANRRLFADRLEQAVKRAVRTGKPAALLYLDLDQFKRVNDTLGHESGDVLLKEVARRLSSCVRQEDTVARPGGDEFTILLSEVRDARAAGLVAQNILQALKQPIVVAGHELIVTTSIGVTITPDDGYDPNQLLKNADLAMYRAKERGRNNYQFYAEDMNTRAMQRLQLERELRRALECDEFELNFQPKVRMGDHRITGAEALLRWNHPERGRVPPDEFISVAEETGVIVDIGEWVLRETCRAARRLADAGHSAITLAVNISTRQFRDPNLLGLLRSALADSAIDAHWIELEITETMLMTDIAEASRVLGAMRDLGIRIAIDDFGTGYSSLAFLKQLPLNILKVDRAFVQDIPQSGDDMAITAAVIAMAHQLNLVVVAEGVETAEQVTFLEAHGCDMGQGYYFARPLTLAAFEQSLHGGTLPAAPPAQVTA